MMQYLHISTLCGQLKVNCFSGQVAQFVGQLLCTPKVVDSIPRENTYIVVSFQVQAHTGGY